jgi:hypothetical protein
MRRRGGQYGQWGKHIDLFELYESWRDDEGIQAELAESEDFEEMVAEGTGSPEGRADFPIFMLTVIRHRMRQAFQRRAAVWDQYLGVERAEDFRVHTVSQLNGLTGMGPVQEFDEYPRIRSSEEMGPPFSVGKHGGVYSVTFEMVVNDDVNLILNRTPTELGRMSAAYVSQVAVAIVETNANWIDGLPFFTATPRSGLPAGNLFTSAAAEPTEDNLVSIIEQMRSTTDTEGSPIDITPANILTRSERVRLNFKRIMRSQETGVQVTNPAGSTVEKGTLNPLAGDELLPGDVIVEPYLQDPNDWRLFASIDRPAFVIAFLRDQREPFIGRMSSQIESIGGGASDPYTLDFDELPHKIRHVFGCAQGDPRAATLASRA